MHTFESMIERLRKFSAAVNKAVVGTAIVEAVLVIIIGVISNHLKADSVFCSPMTYACNEEEVNGVLYIISNRINSFPNETEINLKIFNRVVANWIYRYDECVNQRQGIDLNPTPASV